MKCIKIDLSDERRTIEIHTFADLHLGDNSTDMKLIKERLKGVAENPDAYVIINGDLMNNATKTSISDSYAENIPPMEQIQTVVELFTPIKAKILAMTTGNHESRTYQKEGIDLMEVAACQMELQDKFSKGAALIFVRFGRNEKNRKICYSIYANHGRGGGRKEGAKAIRLADMSSTIDTDIYIHSHTHLPMVFRESYYRVDTNNSTAAKVDKLFVNSAAMMDFGGYGEVQEYKPNSTESPVIYLNGSKKRFWAKI